MHDTILYLKKCCEDEIEQINERYAYVFMYKVRAILKIFNLKRHRFFIQSGNGVAILKVEVKGKTPHNFAYSPSCYVIAGVTNALRDIVDFLETDDSYNWTEYLDGKYLN
jgi:hypothetical protein